MKEDFLHYLWKFKKFNANSLKTSCDQSLQILSVGAHNNNAGPDFFNAKLSIGGQLWAGNVEVHIKSSDWYAHHHEKDTAYNNVILHVVWEDDVSVFRTENTRIPALVLADLVAEDVLTNYKRLLHRKPNFINCENQLQEIEPLLYANWLERLYFERLEQKSKRILIELEKTRNDWEAVLFKMLARNFGLTVNSDSFSKMANCDNFTIFRKLQNDPFSMEALLFGITGLLDTSDTTHDIYQKELLLEYNFLKQKYRTIKPSAFVVKFFRLRPNNFPTIRLSQLVDLYANHKNLFSEIIASEKIDHLHELLTATASDYWNTHYTFGKLSGNRKKKISEDFISLLIINTIIPLKFCYNKYIGKEVNDTLISLINSLPPEKNQIIEKYKSLELEIASAMDSQALLQLYHSYCSQHQCLKCAIGNGLLKTKTT